MCQLTSSQDMLYSDKTVRQRAAILEAKCQRNKTQERVRATFSIFIDYSQTEMCHVITEKAPKCSATFDKGYIDGATTRLCIPAKKRAIRVMQLIVKKG